MFYLNKITLCFAALFVVTCAGAEACSVHIHHFSKSQIEATDVRLYERDVASRDRDVARFDKSHPLIGRLLGDHDFYETELQAWKSHPRSFEHKFPNLWRVIDGEMLYEKKHPFVPPIVITDSIPSIPAIPSIPVIPGGSSPPNQGHNTGGNPGDGLHISSVPEPSSGVLALTGLVLGLIAASRRSVARKLRAPGTR